jgi:hypothetical protein
MSKPEWATTANLSDPGEDWDGTPTRVEPSSGEKAAGFNPNDPVSAQLLNYLIGNLCDWVNKDSSFGDGSHGDATLDGSTDYNTFSSRSGSTYTLTEDALLDDLTINTGVTLKTAGYRVYVKGTLTIAGTGKITADGNDGSGSSGGAASATGRVLGGASGGGGTSGAGDVGTAVTAALGGAGGNGGAGSSGAGGNGGSVTAPGTALGSVRLFDAKSFGHIVGISGGASTWTAVKGGGGGGGGGGDGGGGIGRGGGGGGGVLCVAARVLTLASASNLRAAGGAGVAGAAANTGAGGGGGGGVLIVVYKDKTGAITFSAATNCPGGAGGAVGSGLNAGVAGSNGNVYEIAL